MEDRDIGLRITGVVALLVIQNMEIDIRANEHGTMMVKGVAAPKDRIEEGLMYGKSIGMELIDENGESTSLFQGVIRNIQIYRNGRYREVSIQAVTGTWFMDIEKKSRSFQDTAMTYAEIVKTVIQDTKGSAVITSEGRQEIGKPLIQYQETDWNFIRRLAGLAGAAVIPDRVTGQPMFWFGMRKGKRKDGLTGIISRTIIHDRYEKENHNKIGNMSYIFQGTPGMEIGDELTINSRKWAVYRIHGKLIAGEVVYNYWLGSPDMGVQEPFYNSYNAGMCLRGVVEETDCEQVSLKLDLDGDGGHGVHAYDYSPLTSQIMYCMPEKGTAASLCYMDADERKSVVTDNPDWLDERLTTGDSTMKRLETDCGKTLFLFPSVMGLSAANDNGQCRIMMADQDYTMLESSKNMIIAADGPIKLGAAAIHISVPQSITINQNG